jgi:hypothetical protein
VLDSAVAEVNSAAASRMEGVLVATLQPAAADGDNIAALAHSMATKVWPPGT